MGTRHNIKIKKDGKFRLIQYGQWDGYPDGQGLDVFKFLSNKENVLKLSVAIDKLRFLDQEGRDKKFLDEFDSKTVEEKTEKENSWFNNFISRDVGAKILNNIINCKDEEILVQKDDGSWASGIFTIDLDNMTYRVEYHEYDKTFDINKLPSEKDFLDAFSEKLE